MKSIVCFGEMLLRIGAPGQDPLLHRPELTGHVGGAEANVAISLACLGDHSVMVTALPDHVLGDACVRELRRYGVVTSAVRRQAGRLGLYFLSPPALLRPSSVIYDRAGSVFAEADPVGYDWPAILREASWLHVSGITAGLGAGPSASLDEAVATALKLGVAVSFDCNFRPSLWRGRESEAAAALAAHARAASVLFGGALDVAKMFGQDFPDGSGVDAFSRAAASAFEHCPRLGAVATTLRTTHSVDHHELIGLVADRAGISSSRTYQLQPIVDRVGAGDAFAAGVLHGLSQGFDRQQLVDFGAAACALKHSITGDFNVLGAAAVLDLLHAGGSDIRR